MKKNEKTKYVLKLIQLLKETYPDAHCALHYSTPFELLVATILSAQCTDVRVNMVTPALFKKFGTPEKMAKASLSDIEELIRSTGFYKNKAKNIIACAQTLVRDHGGQVPADLDALVQLGGVGRKTANVVLGNVFGVPSMVVDTHVGRLSQRFGLVSSDDPVKIERALQDIVPREDWTMFSHWLIAHGRAVCLARKPKCHDCVFNEMCPSSTLKA